jgi:hypothetical protein
VTQSAARCLLATLCTAQGAATLAIDLNRTHSSNPLWLKHARLHLGAQAISYALLALIEIAPILTPVVPRAALLSRRDARPDPKLSFLAAFVFRRIYDCTLYDPEGIQPLRVTAFGSELRIDLNLVASYSV